MSSSSALSSGINSGLSQKKITKKEVCVWRGLGGWGRLRLVRVFVVVFHNIMLSWNAVRNFETDVGTEAVNYH